MLNNPKGHIVFDCDGTLISSLQAIFNNIKVLLEEFLEREVQISEIQQKYSGDMASFCANFDIDLSDTQTQTKLYGRWVEICQSDSSKYALFEGIEELVNKLIEQEYNCYVWTGRDRHSTLKILKDLGIASKFLEFRCADDTIPKPHPQGISEMLSGVNTENVVVIGDSDADINGAKNFGCRSIAALWTDMHNGNDLAKYGPSFTAHTPMECLEIIETHIGKQV